MMILMKGCPFLGFEVSDWPVDLYNWKPELTLGFYLFGSVAFCV